LRGRGPHGAARLPARRQSAPHRPRVGTIGTTPRPAAMSIEFADKIRRLPTYPTAGGYALGDEYAMLASNEAPFGLLPGVHDAVERALRSVNRYPDPSNLRLRRALAARYDF